MTNEEKIIRLTNAIIRMRKKIKRLKQPMKKQKHIAEAIGITQAYLSMILKGKRRPSLDTSKKLTSIFGKDPLFWMEASPEEIKEALQSITNQEEAA